MKDYLQKEFDGDETLVCPVCGESYTHLDRIEEYTDEGRKCVKLHFYCEYGHNFNIDFHQHEGITYIEDSVETVEKFHTLICTRTGIYDGIKFNRGEEYAVVGNNNGVNLIYADKYNGANVMLLCSYDFGHTPFENEESPIDWTKEDGYPIFGVL